MPGTTDRLALLQPVGTDAVSELRAAITQNAATLDNAAMFLQGTLAARPAAALDGRFYLATDTGQLFLDNGSSWVQIYPSVTVFRHSWTWDDQTGPNSSAAVLGSTFVNLAANETASIVGAIIHSASPGATPAVFKVQTDHASHGTLEDVTGLTGMAASAAQTLVTCTPFSLAALDRLSVVCTNASTTTSLGCSVVVLEQHQV